MEREVGRELDLHQVRQVAEVGVQAANELLDAGWVLHEIYFTGEPNTDRSVYIMLCFEEIQCPKCGAPASIEVVDGGERLRYICTRECS